MGYLAEALQQVRRTTDYADALAHYTAQAALIPKRNALDLETARYEEVEVTLQDEATCTVRASWDEESGPDLHAVRLEGVWLDPWVVLLQSRIDCIHAELNVLHGSVA